MPMKLLTTRDFHHDTIDFYIHDNKGDFWVTREQIGGALNYRTPAYSIKILHERNKQLFDNLSIKAELNTRRKGIQKTILYNADGLIKLCELSSKTRAPEAKAFFEQFQKEFNSGALPVLFNYETQVIIRVVHRKAQPWFVAKDICDFLDIKNSRDALNALDDCEKATVGISDGSQKRHVNAINESGLYKLIFRSRKPEAKQFTNWVTSEVLPSIRETGKYDIKDTKFLSAKVLADKLNVREDDIVQTAFICDLLSYGFTKDCEWYFTDEGQEKIINATRI